MRISTLLILASMTTALACGDDEGTDTTVGSASETDAGTDTMTTSTTMTATSNTTANTMTDSATTDMTTVDTVDPTTGDTVDTVNPETGDTDPTTGDTVDPDTGTETGNQANCELYCGAFLTFCQDADGGLDGADPYVDMDDCMATCLEFETGVEGEMAGNTLACRGYHLMVATQMADMGHCSHADADGTGVCVD